MPISTSSLGCCNVRQVDLQEFTLNEKLSTEGQGPGLLTVEVLDLPLPDIDFDVTNGSVASKDDN